MTLPGVWQRRSQLWICVRVGCCIVALAYHWPVIWSPPDHNGSCFSPIKSFTIYCLIRFYSVLLNRLALYVVVFCGSKLFFLSRCLPKLGLAGLELAFFFPQPSKGWNYRSQSSVMDVSEDFSILFPSLLHTFDSSQFFKHGKHSLLIFILSLLILVLLCEEMLLFKP